jgi:hypothetical protein
MADLFNHYDVIRTCPACEGTLRAYVDRRRRLLACLGCTWAIPNDVMAVGVDRQLAADRREYAELERAFAAEKGGA